MSSNGPNDTQPYSPYLAADRAAAGLRVRSDLHWQNPSVPLMEQEFAGSAVSIADPGTPQRRRGFWVAAVVLILLVTGMQQWGVIAHEDAKPVPTVEPIGGEPKAAAPLGDDFDAPDMVGRMMVKLVHALPKDSGTGTRDLAANVHPDEQPRVLDAVRAVPAYTEIAGKSAGLEAIERLRVRLADDADASSDQKTQLSRDLDDLTALYTNGSGALDEATRERIVQRHRWQGKLALTFDEPDNDPARAKLISNGGWLLAFLIVIGFGLVCVLLAGLGFCVWALVLIGTGKLKWRLKKPAAGGSLGVEVLVVFLSGFLGLKIVLELLHLAAEKGWLGAWMKNEGDSTLTLVSLLAQWVILPMVVFYPRLRGYPRERYRRSIGWHKGEGYGREILAGITGYLSLIPLYVFAALIALVLSMIEAAIKKQLTGHDPSGPVNPIGGMLSHSWWVAVLVIVLATVWAPIVEETVFRGGLFRQLNARMNLVWAALLSGTVFAMMHGYSPSLFPPLIALGAGFALIRMWRGSLVACITAHALHNGTLTVVMLVMFSLLK